MTFEHVKFGYYDNLLIKDFNVEVKSGQMVAIVGPTGAGKTTIINLLLRFYDVKGGSIKIDGVDIRDLKRGELRSMFGMVLQDTWLYSGSIYDNIRYGRLDARKDEVINGVLTKIFYGTLTYTPTHCPCCGCVYEKNPETIIKYGFKKNCKIKLPKVSNFNVLLYLNKQRFLCKYCKSTFTASTSLAFNASFNPLSPTLESKGVSTTS